MYILCMKSQIVYDPWSRGGSMDPWWFMGGFKMVSEASGSVGMFFVSVCKN